MQRFFELYRVKRIYLSPGRIYLSYLLVILLGQRVDSLEMTISKKKIKAISKLVFPKLLGNLEYFLGLIG